MKSLTLIIDITEGCNLFCEYCYLDAGRGEKYLNSNDVVKGIQKFYEKFRCVINVLFHGGEPLLRFREIEEIISILNTKTYSDQVRYFIQTNGLLINDEIANFFKKNNFGVGISIDGADNKSNFARKTSNNDDSVDIVISNFEYLKNANVNFSILSVITKYNYNNYNSTIDTLSKLGIKSFTLNPFIYAGRGKIAKIAPTVDELAIAYKNLIDYIIKSKNDIKIYEKNLYYMVKKIITTKSEYMCMSSPCGAGRGQFTIDCSGDVYPCADFCGVEEMCLGSIHDKDLFEKMLQNTNWQTMISNNLAKSEHCIDCDFNNVCSAGCVVRSYFTAGKLTEVDPICSLNKILIPYIMEDNILNELAKVFNLDSINI